MKSLHIITLVFVLLILTGIAFFWKKSATMSPSDSVQNPSAPESAGTSPVNPKEASAQNKTAFSQNTNISEEKKSLQLMLSTLAAFSTSAHSPEELVDYLKKTKQDPVMIEDKNEYTGSMFVVRTNSPFPGTRYFHAQYFQDETGKKFVQHMSFEFKPGPHAMQDAVEMAQQNFKNLGKPSSQKDDFAMWELPDGYVLWIKKQNAEDLENNIMNPSTAADIGTIRIAVEQNPHDDHDDMDGQED